MASNPLDNANYDSVGKKKSFWSRPEGKTGTIFLIAGAALIGYLVVSFGSALLSFFSTVLGIVLAIGIILLIAYVALDPKARAVIGYMYKSFMRWLTGIFVTIDPIGILKNYISDLEDNLQKMSKQIGTLRGQMRKIKNLMQENAKEIENNLLIARKAKEQGNQSALTLSTRKAARLRDSNQKYSQLHKRMSILHKVLTKMYSNSEILLEDTKDQVAVKEQEYKAIKTSHSAMKSAMSIMTGDKDKRAMFDQAMEHLTDDVANKVGEMEQFMDMSANIMNNIDLQNGVFEEKGLEMLEAYEKQSSLLLMGGEEITDDVLDLEMPEKHYRSGSAGSDEYEGLFD